MTRTRCGTELGGAIYAARTRAGLAFASLGLPATGLGARGRPRPVLPPLGIEPAALTSGRYDERHLSPTSAFCIMRSGVTPSTAPQRRGLQV
jgi:hypothetical protein